MAARYGIGKDTVARIWQARRIRPWKVETFKLSTDPSFESKLRAVAGLVLAFFRRIDMHVAPDLVLHVILDNLPAHKSQPVRDWLAHKKRRRWHLHFTPTSSSWLNLVEFWFSVLSREALINTSFTSVADLETRIDCWVSRWNDKPEPFVWTRPADEILNKVARGQAILDRITKSATHH